MSVLEQDINHIYNSLGDRQEFANSTILITGAAGFLGYMFVNFLAHKSKHLKIKKIIATDNFMLGKPEWLVKISTIFENVEVFPFDIVKGDLGTLSGAENADYIIHMASIASPSYYRKYPLETLDANVWGLRRLLDFYSSKSIKNFLFFSSSEIYGDPPSTYIPTSEEYHGNVSCLGPRACYDEAKRFGETMCYVFRQKFNTPISVVRPFNNYGPGLKLSDKRAPADFAKAIVENRPITLFSNGSPTRTFCYISDAIIGYLKVMLAGQGHTFNIGIQEPEISIINFAELFIEAGIRENGYSGEGIRYEKPQDTNYLKDNPNRRCPSIEKAQQTLDYRPNISIQTGITRYLRFLKENLDRQ